ncbi:hypothetical protein RP20_CCG009528 [Aedes albopictus]|nr:hypothetical protein RP20_CCG009528 [Aedes albopictus]
MQISLQEVPSFVQRQERDTFGAKDPFNDSWSRAEAAKLELVYEAKQATNIDDKFDRLSDSDSMAEICEITGETRVDIHRRSDLDDMQDVQPLDEPVIKAYLEKSHVQCEYKNCGFKKELSSSQSSIDVIQEDSELSTLFTATSSSSTLSTTNVQSSAKNRRNSIASSGSVGRMETIIEEPMEPKVSVKEILARFETLRESAEHCHKHLTLRDEVYCQLIKQTTANRSACPESAQRAWRLLSILAAYFGCSDALRPYLIEHLTSAASDRRRACHGTAAVCLTNLRKTARCGGRKNVPSVEEVTAVSAGRSARRQIYRLPGGAERIVNTRCSTVVGDVITELCSLLGIEIPAEQQEFSLYCIVQGDAFTMPLAADEYILDVTTELLKSGQPFYLIFCRSVWHFPLKRDPAPTPLYIEVLFNQVAPDYLEGLLLELPNGGAPTPDYVRDMARIAAILHRAADLNHLPAMKEIKFLLPKPALSLRELRPAQWVALVQSAWPSIAGLSPIQVKAQFLNVLSSWPLFGSSFFAVKRVWSEESPAEEVSPMWRELILALNRRGVLFLDPNTHETMQHWSFNEVISTRKGHVGSNQITSSFNLINLFNEPQRSRPGVMVKACDYHAEDLGSNPTPNKLTQIHKPDNSSDQGHVDSNQITSSFNLFNEPQRSGPGVMVKACDYHAEDLGSNPTPNKLTQM